MDSALWASYIRSVTEANETLLEKYLSGEPLTEAEIKEGLRARTIANEIVPMLCGSAYRARHQQRQHQRQALFPSHPTNPTDIPPQT
ncbi:hypothetical protein BMR85_009440 [Achromobacter sp. KAs 3-5]|nr:hypothetical protein BMR85_009440 [Achromobacter sp. KAs 3-5]